MSKTQWLRKPTHHDRDANNFVLNNGFEPRIGFEESDHADGFEKLLELARKLAADRNKKVYDAYGAISDAVIALKLLGEEIE